MSRKRKLPIVLPPDAKSQAGNDIGGWVLYKTVRWYRHPSDDGRCTSDEFIDPKYKRRRARR